MRDAFLHRPASLPMITFKIALVGDLGVGKTSFLRRFITNESKSNPSAVLNVRILSNRGPICFQVRDTADAEKVGIRSDFYTGSSAAIIMFDVTSRTSYVDVACWYREITHALGESAPVVLAANKIDAKEVSVRPMQIRYHKNRKLRPNILQKLATVSVKANHNVEQPFLLLARKLLNDDALEFVYAADRNNQCTEKVLQERHTLQFNIETYEQLCIAEEEEEEEEDEDSYDGNTKNNSNNGDATPALVEENLKDASLRLKLGMKRLLLGVEHETSATSGDVEVPPHQNPTCLYVPWLSPAVPFHNTSNKSFSPWVKLLERSVSTIRNEFNELALSIMENPPPASIFQQLHDPFVDDSRPVFEELASSPYLSEESISGTTATGITNNTSNKWLAFFLIKEGIIQTTNAMLCPSTMKLIESAVGPRLITNARIGYAYFSVIFPGTHIQPHCGPTNLKLRCHLPIWIPAAAFVSSYSNSSYRSKDMCELRVGGVTKQWEEGKMIIFDDSFTHEVIYYHHQNNNNNNFYNNNFFSQAGLLDNNSNNNNFFSRARVVLVIDIWHPDISADEIKVLKELLPPPPPQSQQPKPLARMMSSAAITCASTSTNNDSEQRHDGGLHRESLRAMILHRIQKRRNMANSNNNNNNSNDDNDKSDADDDDYGL